MPDLQTQLEHRLSAAVVAALGDAYADPDPLIRPATDPKFGDFQANLAMGLAKRAGAKPRDLAEKIVAALDRPGLIAAAEVAGPGFINLTLDPAAVSDAAAAMLADDRLGVAAVADPGTVVIDYASPNLAKEMHIGHLRSAIIGDALARVLGFRGDAVIRQNHIGDWGTQFGMLLEHLIDSGWQQREDTTIRDLNVLYQHAKQRDDSEPDFAKRARQRVVALQRGDAQSRAIWQQLIGESVRHMNRVFARLGVLLTDEDLRPESFYNDRLDAVAEDLRRLGVARESEGALCVFPEGHEHPLIVRKSDGGYGYAATDLAAARYRLNELDADRVIYVVDARQRDHFAMFFAAARAAGWAGEGDRLEHVAFGTILGKDRRPFATREGGTVRLTDVLDEAVARARQVVAEKNPDLDTAERQRVAEAVGIGALKYADLSNDRIKDYVFDYDRMLALEGNTAPYMIYSYVRIRSIFRKGGLAMEDADPAAIAVAAAEERQLVLKLAQFPGVVDAVAESLEPHRLCTHLYELATLYHRFFEHCPVLRAETEPTRQSRLALCALTASVIERGLSLLGIGVVERM